MKNLSSEYSISPELEKKLAEYEWEEIKTGWSSSKVIKLKHVSKQTLYLKINSLHPNSIFYHEYAILRWLEGKLPVSQVVHYETNKHEFILMTELLGEVSYEVYSKSDIENNLKILAETLRKIHSMDISDCPYDMSLNVLLDYARNRYEKGLVTNKYFDARWRDKTPKELLTIIEKSQPKEVI